MACACQLLYLKLVPCLRVILFEPSYVSLNLVSINAKLDEIVGVEPRSTTANRLIDDFELSRQR